MCDHCIFVLILGELFGALKGRLYDSNKNLIMATLNAIGSVASAMGPPVEKSSKVIILPNTDHFHIPFMYFILLKLDVLFSYRGFFQIF